VLAEWTAQPSVRADAEHEVYLTDPEVLTALVTTLTASS
jgi:hypothetical protein